jgi:hypothetical protein
MSNRKQKLDPNQMQLDFSFDEQVDEYVEKRMELRDALSQLPLRRDTESVSEFELCVEIAAAIGSMARRSGLSREQIVDGVNEYYGRTPDGAKEDPPTCRKPLTVHMLNKYIAKPDEAPIPAYYIPALQHVCGELSVSQVMVDPEGGKVVTAEESRLLTLGKLEDSISEMNRLRRELKKR